MVSVFSMVRSFQLCQWYPFQYCLAKVMSVQKLSREVRQDVDRLPLIQTR